MHEQWNKTCRRRSKCVGWWLLFAAVYKESRQVFSSPSRESLDPVQRTIISICNQKLYLLEQLKKQGLGIFIIDYVFNTTVMFLTKFCMLCQFILDMWLKARSTCYSLTVDDLHHIVTILTLWHRALSTISFVTVHKQTPPWHSRGYLELHAKFVWDPLETVASFQEQRYRTNQKYYIRCWNRGSVW